MPPEEGSGFARPEFGGPLHSAKGGGRYIIGENMSIKVRIPTPLQPLAGGQGEIEVGGKTVQEVLAAIEEKHNGFRSRLYDESNQLRRFINFYVNDEDIRFLDGENTPVKDGDEISIVPAIAGGI